MRSRGALLAAALLAAACGNGVNDLSIVATPLVTVRGHVDRSQLDPAWSGVPLRAALVWGAVPDYVLACVKYQDNADFTPYCPDPYAFVPASIAADVAIDPDGDGSFELPLMRLPDSSLTVFHGSASIAWGSVFVAADANGNGALSLGPRVEDVPLAASFISLLGPQQRVGFREGGWDDDSTFYPLRACAAPPPGFFILSTPGVQADLDLTPLPGECTSAPLGNTIVEAVPLTASQAKSLVCDATRTGRVSQPPDLIPAPFAPGAHNDPALLCLDAQTAAVVATLGGCPVITLMPLKGCENDFTCQNNFDWDLSAADKVPSWWPCGP